MHSYINTAFNRKYKVVNIALHKFTSLTKFCVHFLFVALDCEDTLPLDPDPASFLAPDPALFLDLAQYFAKSLVTAQYPALSQVLAPDPALSLVFSAPDPALSLVLAPDPDLSLVLAPDPALSLVLAPDPALSLGLKSSFISGSDIILQILLCRWSQILHQLRVRLKILLQLRICRWYSPRGAMT